MREMSMKTNAEMALLPADTRASIAVDLGAESCRVSLLRWVEGKAVITLVHRFANAPREVDGGLRWDLAMIEAGLDDGLRQCAAIATEGCGRLRWMGGRWTMCGWMRMGRRWPIRSAIAMSGRSRRSGRCIARLARRGCVS